MSMQFVSLATLKKKGKKRNAFFGSRHDFRNPNACLIHRKRHSKCPLDCPFRRENWTEAEPTALKTLDTETSGTEARCTANEINLENEKAPTSEELAMEVLNEMLMMRYMQRCI